MKELLEAIVVPEGMELKISHKKYIEGMEAVLKTKFIDLEQYRTRIGLELKKKGWDVRSIKSFFKWLFADIVKSNYNNRSVTLQHLLNNIPFDYEQKIILRKRWMVQYG